MAELEQGLEELKAVKQSFKNNFESEDISTNNVEFRNMPELIKGMEKKLPHQTKNVNPTTSEQVVTADIGYKLTQVNVNAVTSAIDSNIIPTNIRKGKTILGVQGNLEPDKPDQEKTINPSTTQQSVVADTGYELAKVTVNAVTKDIDTNIKAENIKKNVTILGVTGTIEATAGGSPKFAELVNGSIVEVEESDLADVQLIRANAFSNLTNLQSVAIPSNVQTIGASAFEGCSNLQALLMAEGVQSIGANAFNGINASVIDIPSSVTTIGEGAFANNTAITSVTIPSGVTELPANLFSGCTGLAEVTMEGITPPSVTDTTFPANVTAIYVKYGAYDDYVASWTTYADKIVRLPAIPSTIIVTVNNYLGELVSGASVTITGNDQTFTGATDENGVFTQGDLQPATYTISVASLDGFKTPSASEIVVEENTQNTVTMTYLEVPKISAVFGENTPQTISEISSQISANNMTSAEVEATYGWKIGDTISYQLTTGENVEMRIIGFNHDDKSDGSGKAGITMQMTHCLATLYPANSSNSSSGGWGNSKIRTTTLPAIKNTLPQEWQNVIKMVDKTFAKGGGDYYKGTETISDDLFLLAEIEIFGVVSYAEDGANEGSQYEYWKNNNTNAKRIMKYDANGDGVPETAPRWWERSSAWIYTFCAVGTGGGHDSGSAGTSYGVSFAFCI